MPRILAILAGCSLVAGLLAALPVAAASGTSCAPGCVYGPGSFVPVDGNRWWSFRAEPVRDGSRLTDGTVRAGLARSTGPARRRSSATAAARWSGPAAVRPGWPELGCAARSVDGWPGWRPPA